MINELWPIRALGELFEIGAGKTMSAAAWTGDHKTPFLRTSNVYWDEIDLTSVDEMVIRQHELHEKLLRPGDLLVCEGGEIGRAAIWNGELDIVSFQNHLHRLRPSQVDVEPRFYVFFLESAFTQLGIFEGAGNKTTIPNLSRSRLASLGVPHPNIEEQRAIVRILSAIRDALKIQEKAADIAVSLRQTVMRTLFTQGLRGEEQKETEIGPVPTTWDLSPLGNFFQIKHGFAFRSSGFRSVGSKVLLTPGHFLEAGGFRSLGDKTKYFIGDFDEHYLLDQDELLVVMTEQTPGLLGSAIRLPGGQQYLHNQRLGLVSQLDERRLFKGFLFHLLNYEHIRIEIARTSTGSKVKHTSPDRIRAVIAAIPPIDEQSQIAAILDAIDDKIDVHRRKHSVLEDLFKAVLHKLMTGEMRVADLDVEALT